MHLVQVAARPGFASAHAAEVLADLRETGLAGIERIEFRTLTLLPDTIDRKAAAEVAARLLADPVTETWTIDPDSTPGPGTGHRLLVLRRPGVMDPVALSLASAIRAMGLAAPRVRRGRSYLVHGDVAPERLRAAAKRVIANETIEEILLDTPFPMEFPHPAVYRLKRTEIPVAGLTDEALLDLSRQRLLSLNAAEMAAVREHFLREGRSPTDVELETIAQTWSEHCKHKTFAGNIRFRGELIENLLKSTVMRATEEIARDDCLSVFEDNAGVIRLDETRAVCMKVETHNHPSAIEPYGGAGTGIGGVIRDIMGTGRGAWPILNTDVFCFGPPDLPAGKLPKGTLHPRRLMKGVVSGVRDYGNRMGIPTANGAVYFDERYVGNPLVYCGTVGVLPIDRVTKEVRPGDLVLLAGGRTGRDGIHGVTFASTELSEDSERLDAGAVQIGNPIEEKKLLDAQMVARDEGLYRAVTDCGGGGLSSAVGEMGERLGVRVDLEKVPLKYEGLSPLEIWISEAQERMVFAVPPEHRERILEVFAAEESEAVVIGEFTGDGRLRLHYEGTEVADLSMDFLHHGLPKIHLEAEWEPPSLTEPEIPVVDDHGETLRRILSAYNVCSKEWIVRQYDHEVQGNTVVKPLVGVREDGPGDAVVMSASPGERRGIVVACGMNPRYGDLDPYAMAAAAVDEAVRNVLAVGGRLATTALLDNFSWGKTDLPDRLGALVLASRALHDVAVAYRTPFISGKDSLNNEYAVGGETIQIPHTLLVSALSVVEDVTKTVTMDLKGPGHGLYLLGETAAELGGSHYLMLFGETGVRTPGVRPERAVSVFHVIEAAIADGLVASCHDLSEGGLGVALAEMAFAGDTGVEAELRAVPRTGDCDRDDTILFSESQSRFLVEVRPEHRSAFEERIREIPAARIGETVPGSGFRVRGLSGGLVMDETLEDLREAHQAPLRW